MHTRRTPEGDQRLPEKPTQPFNGTWPCTVLATTLGSCCQAAVAFILRAYIAIVGRPRTYITKYLQTGSGSKSLEARICNQEPVGTSPACKIRLLGQADAPTLHRRRGQTDYVSENLEARI
jgi:hypothetical protein